ncbi:response regulator transcription factor [Flavobacterium sp. ZB4P23]|uniref:response regulator transcription factor n=1 Tax=Flavobacterium sp. ZB4P23 TaxID=2497484 RepID=UPI000F8496BD|nr:response regulator transcription factor [Flavobacterium sp. ZB4P23]RTY83125.1 response regulator transcription factor [Flavobacterium sp. ZB4P23]
MTRPNLLLVDDHPITIDGYVNILTTSKDHDTLIDFTTAYSCEEAYVKITKRYLSQKTFDLAFLDISLPPYEIKNIQNGIDLGALIRQYFPKCKIILLTMHSEPLLIHNAIKKINPEGFILKNDINALSLVTAYLSIMQGHKFYSATITKVLSQAILKKLNFDAIDCQILELISRGIKTKDMTKHLNLSLSAIEKRKAAIKNKLLKDKRSDKELIEHAIKIGLL